jgi:hypothetical protein
MDQMVPGKALAQRLIETIGEVGGFSAQVAEAETSVEGGRPDFLLHLSTPTGPAMLLVEYKAVAYPRDIHSWLWQLRHSQARSPNGAALPVLMSDGLSPGAKAILREERIGYFDAGGSLHLPLPGAYVLVDRPSTKRPAPERSLFTHRRALVLHALLRQPTQWVQVNTLAAELQVSVATVSETLTLLEQMEWAEVQGVGPAKRRLLKSPGPLLDAWATYAKEKLPLPRERYFVSGSGGERIAEQLSTQFASWKKVEYMITGEVAGQRYAPFLSQIPVARCRIHKDAFLDPILDPLGAQQASEGANLEFIRSEPGAMFFSENVRDVRLATPVQVYLDLLRLPGRAKEMAAHLRREKIGF